MKTLLELNSPLYSKRLVRELNALPDGFYYQGLTTVRCNRARIRRGALEVRSPAAGFGSNLYPEAVAWITTTRHAFVDCNGREVFAPRTP